MIYNVSIIVVITKRDNIVKIKKTCRIYHIITLLLL